MFGGQTRCIVGDVCTNGEWSLVPLVRSSCHCGCEREGSDIKRDGWVSCFLFATVVKNSKWHLQHDNFISFITLATAMFEQQKHKRLCQRLNKKHKRLFQ